MVFNIVESGDIELKQGDSDTLEFAFTDESGNPVDITGATLYFSVKSSLDDSGYFFQKVVTAHTDAQNGGTEVSITSENTNTSGLYYYECVLVLPDGSRDAFLPESKAKIGKFKIHKGITSV